MHNYVTWITGLNWKVYYQLFDMGKLHFSLSSRATLKHLTAFKYREIFHLISKKKKKVLWKKMGNQHGECLSSENAVSLT